MQNKDLENILIPIGHLSSMLNVHQRTLRIYEEENILVPKRSLGNRRLYSIKDIEKAKLILFLTRNLAINLSGVKIIIEILNKIKINKKDYIDFIDFTAKSVKINQNENIIRSLKRGRKKAIF